MPFALHQELLDLNFDKLYSLGMVQSKLKRMWQFEQVKFISVRLKKLFYGSELLFKVSHWFEPCLIDKIEKRNV